jgi:hypothetical protein
VTVCIAASCEHGKVIVAATDGALSYGGIKAETGALKGWFFDDWLFMYSGEPSSADLISDEIRVQLQADKDGLKRENVRTVLRRAFKRHLSRWASDAILSPFDLDIDEFKKDGMRFFGEKVVADIAMGIKERAQQFSGQILLVGWGSGRMPLLHEESWEGSASHAKTGTAAIGSGATVAMSQMLLLGQNSNLKLEDTLYTVAAAKFAAEQAEGVGTETSLMVLWKRRESDDPKRINAKFLGEGEINGLRAIWEEYGRPQVPHARYEELGKLIQQSGVPNDIRSEGAISQAKWKSFTEKLKNLKPGESAGF